MATRSAYQDEPPYTLRGFVARYQLPKNVRVVDGIYGETDFETLSAEQVITLHTMKRADKVEAALKAEDGETISRLTIPLNYNRKVEILPLTGKELYDNVPDVLRDLPPLVRVVHDIPWLNLHVGNVLRPLGQINIGRNEYLELDFHDQLRGSIKIPVNFGIALEALADAESYFLKEVVLKFPLPVRVRFVTEANRADSEKPQIPGPVVLEKQVEEETVIATSDCDAAIRVLNMSLDLDITVCPEPDPVPGDKTYARFCNFMQDGERLDKFNDWISQRPPQQKEPKVEMMECLDYEEIAPALAPRRTSRDHNGNNEMAASREGSNAVEVCHTTPPPRPPKPQRSRPCSISSQERLRQDPDGQEKHPCEDEDEYLLEWNDCSELHPDSDSIPPPPPQRSLSLPSFVVDCGAEHYGNETDHPRHPTDATAEYPSRSNKESCFSHGPVENQEVDSEDDDVYHDYLEIDELPQPKLRESTTSPTRLLGKIKRSFAKLTTGSRAGLPASSGATGASPASRYAEPLRRDEMPDIATQTRTVHEGRGSSEASCHSSDLPDTIPEPVCGDGYVTTPPTQSLYNTPTEELSVQEVAQWLRILNMQQHIPAFSENWIDGQLMIDMTEAELRDLGVTRPMDVKRIQKFIEGWRPNVGKWVTLHVFSPF